MSQLSYQVDTINMTIDSTSNNFYFVFNNFKIMDKEYLARYNGYRHAIDIFDLDSQKLNKIIYLNREGENAVINPSSLYVHTWDSIFIHANQKLSLIDSSGKVCKSYKLQTIGSEYGTGDLLAEHNFPLQYHKNTGNLFFYNVYSGDIPKSIASSLVATFNIRTNKINLLPIKYSDYYISQKGQFGNLWNASLSISEDKLVYNFQAESNIYIADLSGNNIEIYEGQSKFTTNKVALYNPNTDNGEKHGIESPIFFRVLYDSYRKLYYRIHWGNITHIDGNGKTNAFTNKPLFLMIFDEKMNILDEIQLPEQTYSPYTWFVNSYGLCINSGNAILKNANQDEGKLVIHVLKFTYEPTN